MPARSFGVDWAVYQASGSAAKLRQQGGTFLIAKVTQDVFNDGGGAATIAEAKRAGVLPGAYHFLIEPGCGKAVGYRNGAGAASAADQARHFVQVARAANGGTLDGLICALDLEALNETSMDGRSRRIRSRPNWRHARDFAAAFHKLEPGRPLALYTTSSYLRGADLRRWSQPMELWLARWFMSSENQISSRRTGIPEYIWKQRIAGVVPVIVQYQSGSHGGRAGGVWSDLDASNLSRSELEARLTRPKAAPAPDPTPDPGRSSASTHRSRPSPAACLRGRPTMRAASRAVLPAGTPVRVVRGRIGAPYRVGGSRSRAWLEVSALAGHRLDPPLWAPALAFRRRSSRPRS